MTRFLRILASILLLSTSFCSVFAQGVRPDANKSDEKSKSSAAATTSSATATTASSTAGDALISTVRGKVVYEDSNKPLRRVRLSMYDPASADRGRFFSGWTNGRGEFTFTGVPRGKYTITVDT